jgi:murein DD-endopeptidase MepM/ murein hydrolase activator NlpD
VGGHNKYADLLKLRSSNKGMLISTYQELDRLRRRLYIQSKSYDEISSLLKKKEKMWASRPAIQPINNKELIRIASGYKPRRFNPVAKRWMPHKGIDFTAPKGTSVYSTGDGRVTRVYRSASYGNVIFIDHGYGYETRYAHLNKFNVKRGDVVERGDIIGFVGNTGRSAGDHLHYEVLYKGAHINPINFFQRDLGNEEYEKLIEISAQSTTVLD